MYRLYKKNELHFSLVVIIAYVVLSSLAMNLSEFYKMTAIIEAPLHIAFLLAIFAWIKKNKLLEKYGLCSFKGNLKEYLYFIPLLLIMLSNLWNGVTMKVSVTETVLYMISMLCVGFIEEVIFRGFLFMALAKNNVKAAIIISSVTFGVGHIANLFNGKDFVLTLLQICYAIAIGFLFTVIFYKGKSLLPCIIAHSIINSFSIFAVRRDMMLSITSAAVLCAVSVGYALWILKKAEKPEETNREKDR